VTKITLVMPKKGEKVIKNVKKEGKSTKKLKIVWVSLLCLLMTACSNEFAKREYDSML